MKQFPLGTLITGFALLVGTARADHEIRNGGEGLVRGDVVRLRDVLSTAACHWVMSSDLRQSLPEYAVIMQGLQKANPYFQAAFEKAAYDLTFCFTQSPLLKVDTNDYDSALVDSWRDDKTSVQIGVKVRNEVFMDQAPWGLLSPHEQALFYIHEVSHNLISPTATQHNQRLRTFVRFIDDCSSGRVACDQTLFGFQMRQAGFAFPWRALMNNSRCGLAAGILNVEQARRDCDAKFRGDPAGNFNSNLAINESCISWASPTKDRVLMVTSDERDQRLTVSGSWDASFSDSLKRCDDMRLPASNRKCRAEAWQFIAQQVCASMPALRPLLGPPKNMLWEGSVPYFDQDGRERIIVLPKALCEVDSAALQGGAR